jgi:hypothetical protein
MNCRPGDLAISINTDWPENLGLIVRVVRRHINSREWNYGDRPAWWCVCEQPMTWHFLISGRVVSAHEGPVPDESLRPIRPDADQRQDGCSEVRRASKELTPV